MRFLNKLPLGVLEESINIFRDNLFNMSERKTIPRKIYDVLHREMLTEQVAKSIEKNQNQMTQVLESKED